MMPSARHLPLPLPRDVPLPPHRGPGEIPTIMIMKRGGRGGYGREGAWEGSNRERERNKQTIIKQKERNKKSKVKNESEYENKMLNTKEKSIFF